MGGLVADALIIDVGVAAQRSARTRTRSGRGKERSASTKSHAARPFKTIHLWKTLIKTEEIFVLESPRVAQVDHSS